MSLTPDKNSPLWLLLAAVGTVLMVTQPQHPHQADAEASGKMIALGASCSEPRAMVMAAGPTAAWQAREPVTACFRGQRAP